MWNDFLCKCVAVDRKEGDPLVMSKATKKKHVAREVLEDLVVPNDKQQIVKVSCVTYLCVG